MNKLVVVMYLFLLSLFCGEGVSFAADTGEGAVLFCSKTGEILKVTHGDEIMIDLLKEHNYTPCWAFNPVSTQTNSLCTAHGWNVEKTEVYVILWCSGFSWEIIPGVFTHGSYAGDKEGVMRHIERVRAAAAAAAKAADEAMNNTRNK